MLNQTNQANHSADSPQPTELSPALEAALIAAIQADAADDYSVLEGLDGFQSFNSAQQLRTDFTANAPQFRSLDGFDVARQWELALLRYGYGNALQDVEPAEIAASANRLEYRRGALTEWYVNGPIGIEQGFTLQAPPPGKSADDDPLRIELAVKGNIVLQPHASDQGFALFTEQGQWIADYGQLYVTDLDGNVLTTTLEIDDDSSANETRFHIIVDDANACYPIIIDPLIQTQQAKFTASDATSQGHFGAALAVDGNTVLVGSIGADASVYFRGAVYVFVRNGMTWSQQAKLTASDSAPNDWFGETVALSGDTALIGAPHDNTYTGAAYVFVRSGTTWSQQAKLTASDKATNDFFGRHLLLDGDTALVSTTRKSSDKGAVYVFTRSGSTWSQQAKLTASDGASNDDFGFTLAYENNTAVIGAWAKSSRTGAAYVFVRSSTSWSQQAKLTASDAAAGDEFSWYIDLEDDTALISAHNKSSGRGAAYVFVRSGTSWSQQAKLTASDAAVDNYCGFPAILRGDTVLLGARGVNNFAGAAYVFVRNGTSWSQQAKLTPNDAAANSYFGYNAALNDNMAIISAYRDNNDIGAAYVFSRSGTMWLQQSKLTASDGVSGDWIGQTLAFKKDIVVLGSPRKSSTAGAVYVFPGQPNAPSNTGEAYYPLSWNGETFDDGIVGIRTGDIKQEVTDLEVLTSVGSLPFTRIYRQSKHSDYQFMGLGWTHNHASKLIRTAGSPNIILVHLPNGGELHLTESTPGSNHYVADEGSDAYADGTTATGFTLTGTDKSTWIYDGTGKLTSRTWLDGDAWTYSYTSGKLSSVSDGYGRSLKFVYRTAAGFDNGQLWRVGDHNTTNLSGTPSGRYVEFTYTEQRSNGSLVASPKALLATVRDVLGKVWTYDYYGQHSGESTAEKLDLLTKTYSPDVDLTGAGGTGAEILLESYSYEMDGSKITAIVRAQGDSAIITRYEFPIAGRNSTLEITADKTTTHSFGNGVYQGTHTGDTSTSQLINLQYRPDAINDGVGNQVLFEWTTDGKLLQKTIDPLDNETTIVYIQSGDSKDAPDYKLDALGHKTQFTYGDSNHPRRPTRVQIYDTDGTTIVYWQEWTYDSRGRVLTDKLFNTAGATVLRETDRLYFTSGNGNGLLDTLIEKDLPS